MRTTLLALIVSTVLSTAAFAVEPPWPRPDHPGNIFVEGEEVVLPPATQPVRIFDYENREVKSLGKLPVGYYELRPQNGPRVTFGVIAPLKAPTPATSPIAIDLGMAW